MPSKILFLTTDSELGGTEKTILALLKNINQKKNTLLMAVLKGSGALSCEYKSNCQYYFDLRLRSIFSLLKFVKLFKIIRQHNVECIHSFLFHANIVARVVKFFNPKIIVINSHRTIELGQKWHLLVDRLTKKYTDYELANAHLVRDFYIKKTLSEKNKISVIYNGVLCDNKVSRIQKKTDLDKYCFACIGSFSKAKGQKGLLKAYLSFVKEFDFQTQLIFAGDGLLRSDCEKYVVENDLEEKVVFLGKIPSSFLLLQKIDCLIIPSLWEGLPNVLLEALYASCPVISTEVGGIKEITQDLSSVIKIETPDVENLKAAMHAYIQKKEYYDTQASKNFSRIKNKFSLKAMIRNYEDYYKKILPDLPYQKLNH